jgi:hypothetical protein
MLSTRLNMTGKPSCHNRLKSWVARDVRASLQRCLDTKRLISVTSRWVKAEATLTRELAAQSQYPVTSSKMPTPAAQQITPGRFANMANMANVALSGAPPRMHECKQGRYRRIRSSKS